MSSSNMKSILLGTQPGNTPLGRMRCYTDSVCKEMGLTPKDFLGRTQSGPYPRARVRVYKTFRAIGLSYERIGRLMGKDHSTIIEMLKRYGSDYEADSLDGLGHLSRYGNEREGFNLRPNRYEAGPDERLYCRVMQQERDRRDREMGSAREEGQGLQGQGEEAQGRSGNSPSSGS